MELLTLEMEVDVRYDVEGYYVNELREVEVLTLNFSRGRMRIRYKADLFGSGEDSIHTPDVSIEPFLSKFTITRND